MAETKSIGPSPMLGLYAENRDLKAEVSRLTSELSHARALLTETEAVNASVNLCAEMAERELAAARAAMVRVEWFVDEDFVHVRIGDWFETDITSDRDVYLSLHCWTRITQAAFAGKMDGVCKVLKEGMKR